MSTMRYDFQLKTKRWDVDANKYAQRLPPFIYSFGI